MGERRLLVIDDDALVCDTIRAVAEDRGFAVAAATDARRFEATVACFHPTLMILDLVMPHRDGIEMLRTLKERGCRTPVLLMSGYDDRVLAAARHLGMAYGLPVLGALTKPLHLATLRTVLDAAA